jgi:predicted dehydrogenase
MKIGVIGLGFMGGTHLDAMRKIPDAQVLAVMSRNETRLSGDLSDIRGNLGLPSLKLDFSSYRKYRDVPSMLADADIEAVDLCVPTYLHEPITIEAMARGKHVLVEKPMALDGASAHRMLRRASETKRTLMVAHVLRFMPPYSELTELVRSGRLGTIRSAIFRRRTAVPGWAPWEFDKTKSGGGVFDLLIHDVDIVLHLLGLPDAVSATGFENLAGGIDNITAQFHYEHSDSVAVTGGWHHAGAYPFSMEYTVVADNGVVEFDSGGRPATVYWKDGTSEPLPSPAVDAYAEQIAYFIDCCRTGADPALCPPAESALAVEAARMMVNARQNRGEKIRCEFLKNWK